MEILEVPGALERPAGCQLRVFESDGEYRIEIPARGASPVMWLATIGLTVVLAAWVIMGAVLMITGKPIFILAGIMNHGLTPSMSRYRFLLGVPITLMLAIGAAELSSIIRHSTTRETIRFDGDSVLHIKTSGWREMVKEYPYSIVRSFLFSRDPLGLAHGRLLLVCQGEEIEVGEYLPNVEREWLTSVCNGLLSSR